MSLSTPPQYHSVGIALAIGSGVLIGSSFVFKKKGLLASQGENLGEGVAYLKNPVWWTGMSMMILGELCNFGAYAFVAAIVVTPMGALSVVICAVLSSIFLKERLSLFGWIGCGQCIVGSIIIALNAPEQQSANTIKEFKDLFLAPGFLAYGSVVIASAMVIAIFFAPKYGKNNMLWYISVCSLIGGISVSCTQGLGSCIVTSIRGENQFHNWFIYFLLAFVAVTLVTEIYYLNMALALFNTAMVTPVYFTLFTFCTLVTSLVLYQGVKASVTQIITVGLGFLVICSGISLLQLSKVDPTKLQHLDRRTTILLQAAREEVKAPVEGAEDDPEKGLLVATEEPGLDALRGGFGGFGTISRARRRQSMVSGEDGASHYRRSTVSSNPGGRRDSRVSHDGNLAGRGVRRFQLHDTPTRRDGSAAPPTSFPADLLNGKKKRRDSHDSAAAVRGSVNGDPPGTPSGEKTPVGNGDGNGNADVAVHELREESSKGSFVADDDMTEAGDLSMGMLLAQQQWADHRSSIGDRPVSPGIKLVTPTPVGTKHTTIQFVEPTPGLAATRHRERLGGDVPPISHTPPLLSPSSSSPSLQTPGSLPRGEDERGNSGFFASPLGMSPAVTPEYDDEEPPISALRPAPQRRAVSSVVRQILESTEEVPEDGQSAGHEGSERSGGAHASHVSVPRSRSRASSPSPSPPPTSRASSRGNSTIVSSGAALLSRADSPDPPTIPSDDEV